jgi:hypothetical protein
MLLAWKKFQKSVTGDAIPHWSNTMAVWKKQNLVIPTKRQSLMFCISLLDHKLQERLVARRG